MVYNCLYLQVLKGNTNWVDVVKNSIPVIYARYIRLYPVSWYIRGCIRMELYGQPWSEVPAKLFAPVAPDKALLGHVRSTLNNTNVMECFKLCLVTTQCKSFNFCHQLKTCEVSDSTTTSSANGLEDHQGCNYYEPESYQWITP
ncbi:unnamed protein product [Porites lobata]|uniref:Apple domain-containing protein n=1 Tax=Porites lobata TaxID=104759 RepID=A0ABN8QEP6_9CNID|nr:unnamed protein product [Porites lobata]